MQNHKPHGRTSRRIPAVAASCLAIAALLALAAPAIAHTVRSAPFAFLSRDHVTREAPIGPFSTFEPCTILILR